jgi:hypothetical protein
MCHGQNIAKMDMAYGHPWQNENPYWYPLVNIQTTMEKHHAFNGKIHYFYGDFPVRYVTNYQRVH